MFVNRLLVCYFPHSLGRVHDDHYLTLSRDLPHSSREANGSHWAWTNEATVLTSDMHRGYVVADGWDEIHFTRGARITVSNDGPKLNLATFSDGIYDRVSKWISG